MASTSSDEQRGAEPAAAVTGAERDRPRLLRPTVNANVVRFENAGLGHDKKASRSTVGFVSKLRRRRNAQPPAPPVDGSDAGEPASLLQILRPVSVRSENTLALYTPAFPKYCFDASTYQNFLRESSRIGASIEDLPKPKHALRTKELPYIYRCKIQKGMVMLAKMVPNRPPTRPDHIW